MSAITFSVIDLSCEAADQSFFPPRVLLTTKSTTQIATVLGFPEYQGFISTPPKRYKTLTWEGTSEAQLWKSATEQIAGARFDYSGESTIDLSGNYTSLYFKLLSEMCNATLDAATTCFIGDPNGGLQRYTFPGWFGPVGHQKCVPPGVPYDFVRDDSDGRGDEAILDSSALWGSKLKPGSTTIKVSDFNAISATEGLCLDSGGSKTDPTIIALFEPVPPTVTPPINGDTGGIVWFFAGIVWDHDYTSTLSDEYTDAEALANAQVIVGTSATAQNLPRTTGFVSRFTSVVYTLTCSNLTVGSDYLVSVDLWDPATGVTNTNQIGFTADNTTHVIVAPINTPAAGHSTVVRNPKIAFTT